MPPFDPAPFDPAQFLRVAAVIASSEANEAMLRTAVGRAYYAVFLVARDRLGVVTSEKVHSEVIRLLTRRDRKFGNQMFFLLNLRLAADYQMVPDRESQQDWQVNWRRAQDTATFLLPKLERI
jgi:uncharacterized protein (UPF0332 family)